MNKNGVKRSKGILFYTRPHFPYSKYLSVLLFQNTFLIQRICVFYGFWTLLRINKESVKKR